MTDKLHEVSLEDSNSSFRKNEAEGPAPSKSQRFWIITSEVKRKKRFNELLDPSEWQKSNHLQPFSKGSTSELKKEIQLNDRIAIQFKNIGTGVYAIPIIATIKDILNQGTGLFEVAWDYNLPLIRPEWPLDVDFFRNGHLIELTDHKLISKVFNEALNIETSIDPLREDFEFQYVVPTKDDGKEIDAETVPLSSYNRPARIIQHERLHLKIQRALLKVLRNEYGFENVNSEHPAGYSDNAIDIVVRKDKAEFIYYEIKTCLTALASIREAIGQIIEYHMYPNNNNAKELIIVSHVSIEMNENCKLYLSHLRNQTLLPIYYQSFDLDTMKLSAKY